MDHDNRGPGAYVQRAVEQTREYLTRLVEENERLRLELVKKTVEIDACSEMVAAAATTRHENEHLQKMVALLEERVRTLEKLELERTSEVAKLQTRLGRLDAQLAEAVDENRTCSSQYHSIEKLHDNLMHLYVASYRLHSSLDRQDVLSAITETIINLVGSEDFGVYESAAGASSMELVAWFGTEPCALRSLVLDDGEMSESIRKGAARIASSTNPLRAPDGTKIEILVPLRLGAQTTGAIVIFSLLPQKCNRFEEVDFELFDLLATQAAGALYSTRLHQQFGLAQMRQ